MARAARNGLRPSLVAEPLGDVLPKYRIRSGDVDRSGVWQQGSYDEFFGADDFEAAKTEADRALGNNEIKGIEKGSHIRVDGLDGSASRAMGRSGSWFVHEP